MERRKNPELQVAIEVLKGSLLVAVWGSAALEEQIPSASERVLGHRGRHWKGAVWVGWEVGGTRAPPGKT